MTPEGGCIPLDGGKEAVAAEIVALCIKRQAVRWSRTLTEPASGAPDAAAQAALAEERRLLDFAQRAHLLGNEDGNVTHRIATEGLSFWATPRGVQKGAIRPEEVILARHDVGTMTTYACGDVKPSIDCSVHARLYDALPGLRCMLHFHGGYVTPDANTAYPYPCGTVEEAEECLRGLAGVAVAKEGGSWVLNLVHHGVLVGLGEGGIDTLISSWDEVQREWEAHIREVGQARVLPTARREPIIAPGARCVGIVATVYIDPEAPEGWHTAFILPRHRSAGYGRAVYRRFVAERLTVATHDDCQVTEFWEKKGFTVAARTTDNISIMRVKGATPPAAPAGAAAGGGGAAAEPAAKRQKQ